MLNDRQKKIAFLLKNEKTWKTGQELSNILNVSDRTIRYDIERINESGKTTIIESNMKYGYRICREAMLESRICEEMEIPQTTDQRCFFIIKKLLFYADKIRIYKIAEELFISQNTLEKELRAVKKLTGSYESLRILRKKNCISLEGREQEKRKLYIDLIIARWKNNVLNLDSLGKEFEGVALPLISEKMNHLWEKHQCRIRKEEIPKFLICVATSIKRILCSKYIKDENLNHGEKIKNKYQKEYAIANEFYEEMVCDFDIRKCESEVFYLTSLIAEKRDDIGLNEKAIGNSNLEIQTLTEDILGEINKNFNTDLCEDEEFKRRLMNYIVRMLMRKREKTDISDFYLEEIKGKYPKIFEMAVCAGKVIEERERIKIHENDISYIAQYIGAAIEKRTVKTKYRVVMIYPMNQALTSLCLEKILKVFKDRIYVVACHNYFERKKILCEKPDLILTTLPLHHDLNILTLQISIFVCIEDEGNIFHALNYLDEKRYRLSFKKNIINLIEKRLFFTNLNYKSPMEVIGFLSEKLVKTGYVDERFQEEVMKREQMSPTSFVYSFAVPHPFSLQSKESKIAVGILKNPIKWGEYSVKLVLMLAISEKERQDLSSFFEWLGSTANDYQKISSLMKTDSYEAFIEKIMN